ncbi:MAG: signal recognition particle-docking protein FtsY [Cetobacterium sp.]|uniref:signal recognition particle-docking protein FtsY n=1 Tax=unclassified Cetobacterium TaxID=2630983 RepID=UPI00163CC8D3|nr:signal recognition particle-docking protein FtsY [Cetobacterium sp. 2A]MBC2855826.1 signal recognition particle-docking protein FtsY [Cetobacterium sp. 2A]
MSFFSRIFGKKKSEDIKEDDSDKLINALSKVIDKSVEKEETREEILVDKDKTISEKLEELQDVELGNVKEDIKEEKVTEEKEEKLEEKKVGFFASLKEKLSKTRDGFFGKLKKVFTGRSIIDEEMYEELEDILIQSDIGMDMTAKIVKDLEAEVKVRGIKDPSQVYLVLKDVMERYLIEENTELKIESGKMNVILVVGVNGVGKTTTIGKMASKLTKEGKKVVIGAADTFRAAAIEQLEEWATRSGAEIVKQSQGSDPGAVVFDTLLVGERKKADVVIIDTAGRLHNKNNLMKELEKINNIIKKKLGDQTYETILVLDGTTGQNGLIQARVFNEVTNLSGFVVTKLDGTAKGGILFSISEEIKKPIKFIGVGEGINDLRQFNAKEYISAIFD